MYAYVRDGMFTALHKRHWRCRCVTVKLHERLAFRAVLHVVGDTLDSDRSRPRGWYTGSWRDRSAFVSAPGWQPALAVTAVVMPCILRGGWGAHRPS